MLICGCEFFLNGYFWFFVKCFCFDVIVVFYKEGSCNYKRCYEMFINKVLGGSNYSNSV